MTVDITTGKRRYILFILTLVYLFNFLDRQIMAILLPAIREEFNASDTVLGLLTGTAFALFYVTLGIPVARIADRYSRRNLLAAALAFWSAMTVACGMAANTLQLAIARIGVGIGEAGGSPPSHSIISDLYPPSQRGRAMAVYTLGISTGILLAYLGGGWMVENVGWREAFFIVGAPGVLLALVVFLTVPEPPRGLADARTDSGQIPSFKEALNYLLSLRSFVHISFAAGLVSFIGYSVLIFLPSFLTRSYDMSIASLGLWLGLIVGIAGGAGYLLGGVMTDKLGTKSAGHGMRFLAITIGISSVFYVFAFLAPSPVWSLVAYVFPAFLGNTYLAPVLAQAQSLAGLRMRAMASAITLFIINFVGLAIGPPLVGFVSDRLAPTLGDSALGYSLLFFCVTLLPWASVHFWLASRCIDDELARVEQEAG